MLFVIWVVYLSVCVTEFHIWVTDSCQNQAPEVDVTEHVDPWSVQTLAEYFVDLQTVDQESESILPRSPTVRDSRVRLGYLYKLLQALTPVVSWFYKLHEQ